jgi:hypothetical protein
VVVKIWFDSDMSVKDSTLSGTVVAHQLTEEGDTLSYSTLVLTVAGEERNFTRQDVLQRISFYLGAAAAIYGMDSKEVAALEEDFTYVEEGGSLIHYAFLFDIEAPE